MFIGTTHITSIGKANRSRLWESYRLCQCVLAILYSRAYGSLLVVKATVKSLIKKPFIEGPLLIIFKDVKNTPFLQCVHRGIHSSSVHYIIISQRTSLIILLMILIMVYTRRGGPKGSMEPRHIWTVYFGSITHKTCIKFN